MSKVYANGRSMVHKGDGRVNTCPAPDACKTPSPGGPVPIPYVNVARDGDLSKGSNSVSIDGNPIALKDSNLSTSSGDEPGTAGGGIISSKTKGKMTWASSSIDVKIEGKGAVRFLDICLHNGNTNNTGGEPSQGDAQQDDAEGVDDCGDGKHVERITFPEVPETEQTIDARLGQMSTADKGARFEILAARHNQIQGHLTSGKQISRGRTDQERQAGKKGDWQQIKLKCENCGRVREVDHAYIENGKVVIVEAKDKKSFSSKDNGKALDNAVFAQSSDSLVCYKIPEGRDLRRRKSLEEIFNKSQISLKHLLVVPVKKL